MENNSKNNFSLQANDFHSTTLVLIEWLKKQSWFENVKAIGHRIMYSMQHTKPEIKTNELLNELYSIAGYDPDHLPLAIGFIEL